MLFRSGIQWVLLGSVDGLLFCWSYWLGKHNSNIWNLIPGCLMWTTWTKRNRHSFEDSKFVFFNVQCVHCSQLTLTQVLLQKKILTQGKLSKFIQITLCKCQFMKKCERMKERREKKKNTIGSAIQVKVKDAESVHI